MTEQELKDKAADACVEYYLKNIRDINSMGFVIGNIFDIGKQIHEARQPKFDFDPDFKPKQYNCYMVSMDGNDWKFRIVMWRRTGVKPHDYRDTQGGFWNFCRPLTDEEIEEYIGK